MTTYIAILRGINVSGKNLIRMEALRTSLNDLGFKNTRTYIQSGNIVFKYKKTDPAILISIISQLLKTQYKLEVPVLVLDTSLLQSTVNANPFLPERIEETSFLHVTFLSEIPSVNVLKSVKKPQSAVGEFVIKKQAVYLYCPEGYGNTKLTNTFFEKQLNVTATTRNWKTVMTLLEMVNEQ
ncbi:MAG: DUF1697 domain-containing protein [Sediminibacterium sp.]|nr:DUF1697 domain-containing protein [Sediminibacterium sp.]